MDDIFTQPPSVEPSNERCPRPPRKTGNDWQRRQTHQARWGWTSLTVG